MMLKWMWQWHQNDGPQAWWKTPTIMAHASDKPWHDPNGIAFWKNISRIQPLFNCSVMTRIGNGVNTKFWHDKWLGSALKWTFSNLYHEAANKHATVSQYISHNSWSIPFPALTTTAQNELMLLQHCLQQRPLPLPQLQDELMWIRSSEQFSVRSAYRFLSQTPSPTSQLHNIWSIRAPPRVMIFAWLLLSNRLTTVDNLARRGWSLPNMCTMCKAAAKFSHHLFMTCQVAIQTRDYIATALTHTTPLSPRFTSTTSINMLMDSKENATSRKWEITTSYVLWRERCRRIFADKEQSHMALVREIKLEFQNWFGS